MFDRDRFILIIYSINIIANNKNTLYFVKLSNLNIKEAYLFFLKKKHKLSYLRLSILFFYKWRFTAML